MTEGRVPRAHRLLAAASCALGLALPLVGWAWQQRLQRGYHGQDAAEYVVMGARALGGDGDALWSGVVAPALPLGLGLLQILGAGPGLAAHLAALASFVALLAALIAFTRAVALEVGLAPGPLPWACGGAAALAFGLSGDVLRATTLPLTDAPSVAALLLALALLPGAPERPRRALAAGALLALSYLLRYSSLNACGWVVAAGAVALAVRAGRGGLPRRAAAARLALLAGPLTLAVLAVTLRLSGPELGLSYGANTQARAFLTSERLRAHYPDPEWETHALNDDGTLGATHLPSDAPDLWSTHHRTGRLAFQGGTDPGALLGGRLREPGFLRESLRRLPGALPHDALTLLLGALLWLGLLVGPRGRRSPLLWAATLLGGQVLASALLVRWLESRFLWLPALVALAAIPVGGLAAQRLRAGGGPLRGAGHLGALAVLVLLPLGLARTALDALRGLRGQEATAFTASSLALEGLLEPARAEAAAAAAAGAVPFSRPGVASNRMGHALTSGGRWVPLPRVPGVHDGSPAPELAAARARILGFLRAAGVRYVALTMADHRRNPPLRALFADPLPAGLRLVGRAPSPVPGQPDLARVVALE